MAYTHIAKLASAIKNDVDSGLQGLHPGNSMSEEQLEDEVVMTRLQILKEYSLKGILPVKDLYMAINCIPIDCESIDKCTCTNLAGCADKPMAHFEMPQIMNDYGSQAIYYIGSVDKQYPFVYYTSIKSFKYHKYRKRGKNKPYVWIDITPNANGMYDCFVFNAPLLTHVSVVAIFKDPRQLGNYECCVESQDDNFNFIDKEIITRLAKEKVQYYRMLATGPGPFNNSLKPG